jgi:hypothetical protein
MISNIAAGLGALSGVGASNIAVTYNSTSGGYVVQFMGTLGTAVQPVMTINTTSGADSVTQKNQYANAQLNTNGNPFSVVPYNGSKGNWRLDNIFFHGSQILPGWLSLSAGASVNWSQAAETLQVNSGTATIIADPAEVRFNGGAGDDPIITATGASSVEIAPTDSSLQVHIASLTLQNGATAAITPTFSQTPTTLDLDAISIAANSSFDVANNVVMISYTPGSDPIATIRQYLTSGSNGGAWNGPGIDSTQAQLNSASYGLGYGDSADPGNPCGLAANTIKIMYTLLGDANLDGTVNGVDFGIVSANFNKGVTAWDDGDFNYDDVVNGVDFGLLSSNFNKGDNIAATVASPQTVVTHTTTPSPKNRNNHHH